MSILYTKDVILATLMQQLDLFLTEASVRNIWICAYNGASDTQEPLGSLGYLNDMDEPLARVYVRKSRRDPHKSREITCLDIGSIWIAKDYRGKGLFRSFVTEAHRHHPYPITYIQSVMNPLIEQWCRKYGWKLDPDYYPPCFSLTKDMQGGTQEILLV